MSTVTPDFSQRLPLVSVHCAIAKGIGIVDNTVQKIVETAVE